MGGTLKHSSEMVHTSWVCTVELCVCGCVVCGGAVCVCVGVCGCVVCVVELCVWGGGSICKFVGEASWLLQVNTIKGNYGL